MTDRAGPGGGADERSRRVAAVFDQVAATYDHVGVPWFTPIAERLVAALAPATGEDALDVGCGRGAVTFALAEVVGATGTVTGIDLSEQMLEATRADVRERGVENVDLRLMNASDPDLEPESYDLVASSLVLFFLPDPAAALTAWRRLLVSGGRLGITTFGRRSPLWEQLDQVFRPFLPQQMLDARTSGVSGPFASDEGVANLVAEAGFGDVRTHTFDQVVHVDGFEQWETWSRSHGQRAMWDQVPPDELPRVRGAARELVDGPTDLQQLVRVTLARRA